MTGKNDDPYEKISESLTKAFGKVSKGVSDFVSGKPSDTPPSMKEFFRAVRDNNAAAVKKMIDAGFDPNSYNNSGQTPMHIAAVNNAVDAARVLIEHRADPLRVHRSMADHTPMDDAINFNRTGMVDFLMKSGGYSPKSAASGWTALHRAVEKGNEEVVDILLKNGVNPNETTDNGTTPLLLAVKNGHVNMVRRLLQSDAVAESMNVHCLNTDDKKRTAFQYAVERGNPEMISLMIGKGGDVDAVDGEGVSVMAYAIKKPDDTLVQLLAQNGANLNDADHRFGTALMQACTTNRLSDTERKKIINTLMAHGADPDVMSPETKMSTLHWVLAANRPPEMLEALLAYPIDKEARNGHGQTPLLQAIATHGTKQIQMLLAAGVNPNARHGEDASTPLMEAVRRRNLLAIEALLRADADPTLLDGYGKSALSYAREQNHTEIISHLEQALRTHKKSPHPSPK